MQKLLITSALFLSALMLNQDIKAKEAAKHEEIMTPAEEAALEKDIKEADKEVEKAYWLPIDARKEDNANWISADDIVINVKGIPARHVLIVSDSCFAGTIARSSLVEISDETTGR